ncbi:hypothetical protein ACRAWF_29290 [Streptomyces sp. L7]
MWIVQVIDPAGARAGHRRARRDPSRAGPAGLHRPGALRRRRIRHS